jgi:hypothetical protein
MAYVLTQAGTINGSHLLQQHKGILPQSILLAAQPDMGRQMTFFRAAVLIVSDITKLLFFVFCCFYSTLLPEAEHHRQSACGIRTIPSFGQSA